MPLDKRVGHKIIKHVRTEEASGVRMDPGPFIGIVKHVLDPTHSGRLQVYLPHLGGDPENPNNQKIVQYASPFAGYSNFQKTPNRNVNTNVTFETVRHSYGMWFTPPDVGVKVLVVFEASNANNGYWIACLPNVVEHNQTGSSGGALVTDIAKDDQTDGLISGYGANYAPAVDYNAAQVDAIIDPNALDRLKAPHRVQTKVLAEQGLLADPDRGIDNATSIRETPSGAFGVTTPGRTYNDQATDDYLQQVSANPNVDVTQLKEAVIYGRKGGHQLIMDDGDVNGNQRRVKIRSAAGHQIIMDDTTGMLYISNSTGKVWLEFANDGQVLLYAESDISIRTGGDFNLKADGNFNHEVNGDYNLKVRGNMKTEVDVNREEIVVGNKDINITGRYHKTVVGSLQIDAQANYSLAVAEDIAVDSTAAIGIKSADDTNIQAGENMGIITGGHTIVEAGDKNGPNSGWKSGEPLAFEAPEILLNTSPPGTPGTPVAVVAPTVPQPFPLVDLNDTVKNGDIWQHNAATASTGQTMMPKITTHEPYSSRVVVTLVSATGTPSRGL